MQITVGRSTLVFRLQKFDPETGLSNEGSIGGGILLAVMMNIATYSTLVINF